MRNSTRFLALALAAALAPAPAMAQLPTRQQCDAAYAQAQAEMQAGAKLESRELWWSVSYLNAQNGRVPWSDPCNSIPPSLLARAGKGTSELDAIPFDVTSPDGRRWKVLWDELAAKSVGDMLKFGVLGSDTVVIGAPSELEQLSVKLSGRNLMRFGGRYQFRIHANIEAFCSHYPGADCMTQRTGFSLAWSAKMRREAKPVEFAAVPERRGSGGSWTSTPPSAAVTVRAYDAQGNYLGSTVTTRTDASLMGAR